MQRIQRVRIDTAVFVYVCMLLTTSEPCVHAEYYHGIIEQIKGDGDQLHCDGAG